MADYRVPVQEYSEWQFPVIDKDLTSPPAAVKGDAYIVGSGASGAWTSQDGNIAWYSTSWNFVTKREGMIVWVKDEDKFYYYTGSAWVADYHEQSFVNGDLSSGILTVTHNLGKQYPQVIVYDNNGKKITPDDITATSTSVTTIDLTSFGTITGTWNLRISK